MDSDMAAKPRLVLDTNIIISAIGFGGKPRNILLLSLENSFQSVTSPTLLTELQEVITKKFPKLQEELPIIEGKIKEKFLIVKPKKTLDILRDKDDNRVLEAALEGKCSHIVTGDKDLLDLGEYKGIKIVTANQFLKNILEN